MKAYFWIRRDAEGVVHAAICEERYDYAMMAMFIYDLREMAADGPIERVQAETVTIGALLEER